MDLKQLLNIILDARWNKYSWRLQVVEGTRCYVHWKATLSKHDSRIAALSITGYGSRKCGCAIADALKPYTTTTSILG
jgi:hypothetical protein